MILLLIKSAYVPEGCLTFGESQLLSYGFSGLWVKSVRR